MEDLTGPKDLREWASRAIALPSLLVGAALAAMIFAEWQLHWIERAVGAYLVSTNSDRPESGAIWEKGRKTRSAHTAIDRLAGDRESQQRLARNAGNVNEIIDSLAPGQGAMLSAEHFRELYRKMPQELAAELISPFELLYLANEGRWNRTYLEKASDGLMVYLLEPNNHVLRQFNVAAANLVVLARSSEAFSQTLDQIPGFQGRIYPADRFFSALASLGEEERRGVVNQPERLIEVPGRITRVGLSDEALAGLVDIGFEVRTGDRMRVLMLHAQDWALWRLRALLEGKGSGTRHGGKNPQERGPSP